jgi:hypothetical protein
MPTATSRTATPTVVTFAVLTQAATLSRLPLQAGLLEAFAQALMTEATTGRLGTPSTTDRLVANPPPLLWRGSDERVLQQELAAWRASIEADACVDASVNWQAVRLDPRDGAFFRSGTTTGSGGAYLTEHAAGQLLGVLGAGGGSPRGLFAPFQWAPPAIRAQLLVRLLAVSKRKTKDPVVIRTAAYRTRPGEAVLGRIVRAVVTPRHALQHYDDAALADVIERVAPAHAKAAMSRTLCGTETRGWCQRDTLNALRTWASQPAISLTLNLRGVSRSVVFNHEAGALDAEALVDYADPNDDDYYIVTIRYLEL